MKAIPQQQGYGQWLFPSHLFSSLAGEPGAVWLDSSLRIGDKGKYSFICRRPSHEIFPAADNVVIRSLVENKTLVQAGEIFDILQSLCSSDNKFAVGYITFEAVLSKLGIDMGSHNDDDDDFPEDSVPKVRFLLYDSVLKFDHDLHSISVTNPEADDYRDIMYDSDSYNGQWTEAGTEFEALLSRQEYIDRVQTIKRYIHEGDIYQANFTTRFIGRSTADPFAVYSRLRELNPSPYGAYLNFGDFQILSSSPERMLKLDDGCIGTSPIKGTIARGSNNRQEQINLQRLMESDKDRAELLMIVDLERNDLGRIARTGSVSVDRLCYPEVYSSLIHLVSDISARLRDSVSLSEVMRAMLPGGSVTGAPKKRAVEIIRQLEPLPRLVYTGCIGYVDNSGADFNLAIRTMLHRNGRYLVQAGGGIVADSDPDAEYREMLLKARNLLRAVKLEGELSKSCW